MQLSPRRLTAAVVLLTAVAAPVRIPRVSAQGLNSTDRTHMREILHRVQEIVRGQDYDATFRGIDLKEHFKAVQAKVDAAPSTNMAYALIAQSVIDFNDSHTYCIPPMRPEKFEYGWERQMIGDDCFVVAVKPGSDAEAKGLKPGDQLLRIERFGPTRKDLWKLQYADNVLAPRPAVQALAQSPGGPPRELELKAKVTPGKKVIQLHLDLEDGGLGDEYRLTTGSISRAVLLDGVAIWKQEAFAFPFEVSVTNADLIMKDGKSLEHVGVVPDELLLPTAADLAAERDPVLARAVAVLGGALDPAAAGKLFPIEWK